jgi:rod shape-determining protein MreC
VRGVFAEITTPISSGFDWVRRGSGASPAAISELFRRARRECAAEEAARDQRRADRAGATLNQENRRLREMLKLRDVTTDAVVAARLVNSSRRARGAMPRSTRDPGRA